MPSPSCFVTLRGESWCCFGGERERERESVSERVVCGGVCELFNMLGLFGVVWIVHSFTLLKCCPSMILMSGCIWLYLCMIV